MDVRQQREHAKRVVRKPAIGPQLWRLNDLGLLGVAIEPDGRVDTDRAGG